MTRKLIRSSLAGVLMIGITAAAFPLLATPASATTISTWTDTVQCGVAAYTTAPANANSISVVISGGEGGEGGTAASGSAGSAGLASKITASFGVYPGEQISAVSGCAGNTPPQGGGVQGTGGQGGLGWSNGGNGGDGYYNALGIASGTDSSGGGGGGSSAICLASTCPESGSPIVVAAGGGAGGESMCATDSGGNGGNGGGSTVEPSSDNLGSGPGGGTGGTGGDSGLAGGAGGVTGGGGAADGQSAPNQPSSPVSGFPGGDIAASGGGGGGYSGGSADQGTNSIDCPAGGGGGGGSSFTYTESGYSPTYTTSTGKGSISITFETTAIALPVSPYTTTTTPSAPVAPTATASTGTNTATATVNWVAPGNGGSAITGWTITPYVGTTAGTPTVLTAGAVGSPTDPTPGAADSTVVTGLTVGTTYTFTVTATNTNGAGTPSPKSNPVTPTGPPPIAPTNPIIGTATAGNASATVTWTVPAATTNPDFSTPAITEFIVTPYENLLAQTPVDVPAGTVGSITDPTPGAKDSFLISGLAVGQSYTFSVEAVNSAGTSPPSSLSNAVVPDTVPGAPTIGTAADGNLQAIVSWTAPTSDGGGPITGYVVTAYVAGSAQFTTTVGDVSTADVTGLVAQTVYTFSVHAVNSAGAGAESGQTTPITAVTATPGPYTSVAPLRICDTRAGNPSDLTGDAAQCNGTGDAGERLVAGTPLTINVGGSFGVPADATTAVLNVTASNADAAGYITVYPAGGSAPTASNVNFKANIRVPNLVEVGLGTSGQVDIVSNTDVDVVVDLEGYVAPESLGGAGLYEALATPARICDTRPDNFSGLTGGDAQCNGTNDSGSRLSGGSVLNVQVEGNGGVPSTGVSAVVLNVTAVNPSAAGYVTVYPGGTSPPTASNLNYQPGETVPNRVIVPLSSTGGISVTANQATDLAIDVSGWYTTTGATTGTLFTPEPTPIRICDTRSGDPSRLSGGAAQCNGSGNTGDTLTASGTLPVTVTDLANVPSDATAVVLNVTATGATRQTHLTVFPSGTPPIDSDLNPSANESEANLAVATVSATGSIDIFNYVGSVNAVVDVEGWYAPQS